MGTLVCSWATGGGDIAGFGFFVCLFCFLLCLAVSKQLKDRMLLVCCGLKECNSVPTELHRWLHHYLVVARSTAEFRWL